MQTITPESLYSVKTSSQSNYVIIDVRTKAEFNEAHIEGSINIELSIFNGNEEVIKNAKTIYIVCKGGVRASKACAKLPQDLSAKAFVLDGGIDEWVKKGHSTISIKKCKFSLIRQFQIVVGGFVLGGSLLSMLVSKYFIAIALFFGSGLLFAGLSGTCLLMNILSKMPWNK